MWLTVQDIAERLNISKTCVYSLIAGQGLPHVRVGVGRGTIRVREEDLTTWLEQRLKEKGEKPSPVLRPKLKHIRL